MKQDKTKDQPEAVKRHTWRKTLIGLVYRFVMKGNHNNWLKRTKETMGIWDATNFCDGGKWVFSQYMFKNITLQIDRMYTLITYKMKYSLNLDRRHGNHGGYSNYFLTGCAARGLKTLLISKDFSPSKNGWFYGFFFFNLCKSGPISKGFSTSKMAGFTIFFAIFVKWDPLLRIVLAKMGPMSKDFYGKSNPFVRHIPVCLNMWVPPKTVLTFSKQNKSHSWSQQSRRHRKVWNDA